MKSEDDFDRMLDEVRRKTRRDERLEAMFVFIILGLFAAGSFAARVYCDYIYTNALVQIHQEGQHHE